MIPPSLLAISQGWGLIDLPLRASNEGSPRPRVARAQEINRLHPTFCSGSKESSSRLCAVPCQAVGSTSTLFYPHSFSARATELSFTARIGRYTCSLQACLFSP